MIRNRIFSVLASITALTLLTSCQKTALEKLTGSYTYKTSGMLGLVKTQSIGSETPLDTVWIALIPEQGQMNIVTKDAGNSVAIVTWNDLSGDAFSTDAAVDGNTFTLTPNRKSVTLADEKSALSSGIVDYKGKGTLYDNMLILPMEYNGIFSVRDTSMTVVDSKVECIAKAN